MIDSLDALGDVAELQTGICIVGAGPAGITIASEFLGGSTDVLLLESGNFEFAEANQNLFRGTINNSVPWTPLHVSRLRLCGGASNHWEGACGPLNDIDYRERSWIPRSGWPFGPDELGRYYLRASEIIGLGALSYDPADWATAAQPLLPLGDAFETVMRHQQMTRFGLAYRDKLEQSRNVRLLLQANLTRINRSADGRAVESLTVQSLTGKSITVRARNYILACGGVENARLLLANDFDRDLDYVGRCFQFHARTGTGLLVLSDKAELARLGYYANWQMSGDRMVRFYLRLNETEQERRRIANHAIVLESAPPPAFPLEVNRIMNRLQGDEEWDGLLDDVASIARQLDVVGERLNYVLFGDDDTPARLMTRVSLDQVPNPDSRVTLNDDVDALGMRRVTLNWTFYDEELQQIAALHEQFARAVGAAGIGRLQLAESLTNRAAFVRATQEGGGGGHQLGTTRISATAANGVVDSNCRVHGTSNLYCAGSSVFPTGGWINPTLTIVALAARLADHLRAA